MSRTGHVVTTTLAGAAIWLLAARIVQADDPIAPAQQQAAAAAQQGAAQPSGITGQLFVTVGKSLTIDSPLPIKRLSAANGTLADVSPIGPKEVLINGKAPGETSLIVWQEDGTRLIYDLTVRQSPSRLNAVREQLAREYPDADLNVTFDNDTAFVRGSVKDVVAAERVMAIVGSLGKSVNLLRVEVPAVEAQILLKVRFADVDRNAKLDLSANFASGAFNQKTAIGTGPVLGTAGAVATAVGSAVNIFALRPDLNLMAAITALEGKNMLQILAEPNLVAINGKQASFTAGGQFPILTPQVGSGGGGTVMTVTFKEWGILLEYTATVTPRGTIRLHVKPEVSSLDYANAVPMGGALIPGLTVRKAETELELESGQSFVIAGLLDKQTTESFSKIPGISSIPILGNLFKSKTVSRNNSELMILITPELVRPIPAQQAVPELSFPRPFLPDNTVPRAVHPGMDKTGPVPVHPPSPTLPVEQLTLPKAGQAAPAANMPAQTPPGPGGQPPAGPDGQTPAGPGGQTAPGPGGAAQTPPAANPPGGTGNGNGGAGGGQ